MLVTIINNIFVKNVLISKIFARKLILTIKQTIVFYRVYNLVNEQTFFFQHFTRFLQFFIYQLLYKIEKLFQLRLNKISKCFRDTLFNNCYEFANIQTLEIISFFAKNFRVCI